MATLLTVHAHPDDEASKGAGTIARYSAAGVRCVLVCCTGGEAGDILNGAVDTPENRERLHDVRMAELARSAEILGYDEVIMLGYRDSGMPDSEHNVDPRAFAQASLDEAVGRLVAIFHRVQPDVVVTYGEDQKGYPHPDHLRVHDVTVAAYAQCHFISKLYYSVWSTARNLHRHQAFLDVGLTSPYSVDRLGESNDHLVTASIDVSAHREAARSALLAHATQIAPDAVWWIGIDPAAEYPWDEYQLASARVETTAVEDDLFSGV